MISLPLSIPLSLPLSQPLYGLALEEASLVLSFVLGHYAVEA